MLAFNFPNCVAVMCTKKPPLGQNHLGPNHLEQRYKSRPTGKVHFGLVCGLREKINHGTQDSRVVPHRGTVWPWMPILMKHSIYTTIFSGSTSDQHFAFLMFFRIHMRDSDYDRLSADTTNSS